MGFPSNSETKFLTVAISPLHSLPLKTFRFVLFDEFYRIAISRLIVTVGTKYSAEGSIFVLESGAPAGDAPLFSLAYSQRSDNFTVFCFGKGFQGVRGDVTH